MAERKKIAAVITEYRVPAHADVIVGKFIKGFPTDNGLLEPQVDVVSMYLDQIPDNDIGVQVAAENGIPIYQSVQQALCLGGSELAVDGVPLVGADFRIFDRNSAWMRVLGGPPEVIPLGNRCPVEFDFGSLGVDDDGVLRRAVGLGGGRFVPFTVG